MTASPKEADSAHRVSPRWSARTSPLMGVKITRNDDVNVSYAEPSCARLDVPVESLKHVRPPHILKYKVKNNHHNNNLLLINNIS